MTAAALLNDLAEALGNDLCKQFVTPEMESLSEVKYYGFRPGAGRQTPRNRCFSLKSWHTLKAPASFSSRDAVFSVCQAFVAVLTRTPLGSKIRAATSVDSFESTVHHSPHLALVKR